MGDTILCECEAASIVVYPDSNRPGYVVMSVHCFDLDDPTGGFRREYKAMVAEECIDVAALVLDRHPHRHEARDRVSVPA